MVGDKICILRGRYGKITTTTTTTTTTRQRQQRQQPDNVGDAAEVEENNDNSRSTLAVLESQLFFLTAWCFLFEAYAIPAG